MKISGRTNWIARLWPHASVITAEDELRRRMLLSEGARLRAGFAERFDQCSLAMLDLSGTVVSWYDGLSDEIRDDDVLHRHVSQFYVPSDIAADLPGYSLRCAANCGADTQQGWRRRPAGAIYWGTTVVESFAGIDGRALGFAHVTRRSCGPWEAIRISARPPERRRPRARVRWSFPESQSGLAAV